MEHDRFTYGAEDAPKVELSQCIECKHDETFDNCGAYGIKPDIYAYNNEKCPYKTKSS